MIALQIDFIAGRFHANPWEDGLIGGEIEWPPSPWRVLCSIVAGWRKSGAAQSETLLQLIDALAECPVFDLPLSTSGDTRHRPPTVEQREDRIEGALALDSFLTLERGREHATRAFAIWPRASLDKSERALLEMCCAATRLVEQDASWNRVSVVTEIPIAAGRFQVDLASRQLADGPIVRRLAIDPSHRQLRLLRTLSEATGEVPRSRRIPPAGARWVEYQLPLDFGWAPDQALQRDIRPSVFPPTILRFALRAEGGAFPSITDSVTVAERMRQASLKRHSAESGAPASKRLAGKQRDGSERREGHDHAFFLPLDLGGRGVVDGLDVWLPAGCTHDEFRALTGVSAIWDNAVLEGTFPVTYLGRVEGATGTVWATSTPVVLDRFPKRRGPGGTIVIDAPEEQLRQSLIGRGFPPASVEVWNPQSAILHGLGGQTRLDAFRRARSGERQAHPLVGATIRFERAVTGPIVLGRLAHFGLGRFEPVPSAC